MLGNPIDILRHPRVHVGTSDGASGSGDEGRDPDLLVDVPAHGEIEGPARVPVAHPAVVLGRLDADVALEDGGAEVVRAGVVADDLAVADHAQFLDGVAVGVGGGAPAGGDGAGADKVVVDVVGGGQADGADGV